MHPSPRFARKERLQEAHLLRFLRHWMQQGAQMLSDALSLLEKQEHKYSIVPQSITQCVAPWLLIRGSHTLLTVQSTQITVHM